MLVAAHQVARYCCCCCTHLRCSGPWLAASEKWAPGLSCAVWMDILGSLALHLFIHEIEIIPEDYGRADKGNEKNVKSTCNNCVWGNVGGGAYHSSPLTRPHSLKDFHFTHHVLPYMDFISSIIQGDEGEYRLSSVAGHHAVHLASCTLRNVLFSQQTLVYVLIMLCLVFVPPQQQHNRPNILAVFVFRILNWFLKFTHDLGVYSGEMVGSEAYSHQQICRTTKD